MSDHGHGAPAPKVYAAPQIMEGDPNKKKQRWHVLIVTILIAIALLKGDDPDWSQVTSFCWLMILGCLGLFLWHFFTALLRHDERPQIKAKKHHHYHAGPEDHH